ncbi:hypothetical protein DAI22_11g132701 [Oryza sativa Japonica Group]|nr:hypothetical protein DAI22_11g132701 [Oryza sativa Japonica Group]
MEWRRRHSSARVSARGRRRLTGRTHLSAAVARARGRLGLGRLGPRERERPERRRAEPERRSPGWPLAVLAIGRERDTGTPAPDGSRTAACGLREADRRRLDGAAGWREDAAAREPPRLRARLVGSGQPGGAAGAPKSRRRPACRLASRSPGHGSWERRRRDAEWEGTGERAESARGETARLERS